MVELHIFTLHAFMGNLGISKMLFYMTRKVTVNKYISLVNIF